MTVTDIRTFLEDEEDRFDAMVYVAEIASAWSLLHPEFASVVPDPPMQNVPLAYPLPLGEPEWKNATIGAQSAADCSASTNS